ncbi:glycine cleavage system protein GcvH [Roseomonas marmotae]|uniref:Glycine cleavage system H protein n=1 Tax=Roseomonas marmotae TaxID=2768161 RepID=A0ABS3K9L7_9PROT|nr:glycine cleavage system protein GcvH [Roseomonas marmotae]MBO1074158.1 glycine cleavage system protein GcvH [Roseomonas marmotae]QTI78935.1 glycine cleavage system protein GcvH [Roseomonas marmotae]
MAELKFTKDHEWVRLEGGVATIGITEHAQNALGDVVFVELPEAGREVAAEEAVAVVESVKAASDVYAPIAGKVVEANQALVDDPALANSAPTTDGWFFKMEPADPASIDALMSEADYAAFVSSL